jgi:hypothetical protein
MSEDGCTKFGASAISRPKWSCNECSMRVRDLEFGHYKGSGSVNHSRDSWFMAAAKFELKINRIQGLNSDLFLR